jgi:hypothetical protein
MLAPDLSKLDWYKRAGANLRKYMARLEADRAALERSGADASATKQLMVEVARRLAQLDKLVVNEDAEA